MSNLLAETKDKMSSHNKTFDDVAFIGSRNGTHGCTVEQFQTLANIVYDAGYGGAEVAEDLVIVFTDHSWLERGEYDGSEWWNYLKTPTVPDTWHEIQQLTGSRSWATVAELQEPDPWL